MTVSPSEFGAAFQGFMEQMREQGADPRVPFFRQRLSDFFNARPETLTVVGDSIETYDHPNFQLALEQFLQEENRRSEMLGFQMEYRFGHVNIASLLGSGHTEAKEGPLSFTRFPLQDGQTISCIDQGLVLIEEADRKAALLLSTSERFSGQDQVHLEVMAATRDEAEKLLADLRRMMHLRNVYRGKTLSIDHDRREGLRIVLHRVPKVDREQIVLPGNLLERIERLSIDFSRKGSILTAAGRHLKRGLLLHGVPGTGKTLTAMYLCGAMEGRTVLLLTGRGLGLIETCCYLARLLQPSTVILEDVDLIAEERSRRDGCAHPVLFELLNQMDGLAEDADILFLLTTNRPDILEPALAARPGRIDQAFEIPLPDAAGRRRLFDLYGQGLQLQIEDWDRLIARTEGASGAFIRELLRKAALFATDRPGSITILDVDLDRALHEMVIEGGTLTQNLLGYRGAAKTE